MSQSISYPQPPQQKEAIEANARGLENQDADPVDEEDSQKPYGEGLLSEDQLQLNINLAEFIDEADLSEIGRKCKRNIDIDESSRSEWLETNKKALDLAMQVAKEKSYPHARASNVVYPLITVAAIQFAQRCYPAVVPGERIVNCAVVGDDSGVYEVQTDPSGRPILPQKPGAKGESSAPGAAPPLQPEAMPGGNQPPAGGGMPQGAPEMATAGAAPQPSPEPKMVIPPGAKADRADRVSRHMSWQCLNIISEWEPGIDQLLTYLPIAGCAFRKVFYDSDERRPAVEWYPGDKFIINAAAKSIKSAARFAVAHEFYPFQIKEMELRGEWLPVNIDSLPVGEGAENDDDQAPRKFFDVYCRLDLDGSGYSKPFIVTMHEDGKVVRIERNWKNVNENGTINPIIDFVKYSFIPNPRGGFYDVGFGWLLSSLNESINSTINQLFDAGHWQNAPTGLFGRGIRTGRAGDITLEPNKFKKVDTTGEDLQKNIWHYKHPGPSPTLFQLLGLLIEAGQSISSVQDIMQGRMDQNIAPTTAVTLVEQGMTTFTSIFKRVHRSLKLEFEILYRINGETLPEHMYQYAEIIDDPKAIAGEDYKVEGQDIRPVTDPKMVSDQVRRAKAAAVMDMASKGLVQQVPATKRMLESLQITDFEELLPDENVKNPMQEMAIARMALENDRLKQDMENDRIELKIKADEMRNKILEIRANAIKRLAEAEAVEAGPQLEYYKSIVAELDSAAASIEKMGPAANAA